MRVHITIDDDMHLDLALGLARNALQNRGDETEGDIVQVDAGADFDGTNFDETVLGSWRLTVE